ncbi:MAG: DUF4159 domain-containing protein, partial [Planctomycetales bacterium]|nr:DUF4159 domain-containing protein [Planctomycetales bacterium]
MCLCFLLVAGVTLAQRRGRRGWDDRPGSFRGGVPEWKNDEAFRDDIFTFARVRYTSWGGNGWGRGGWRTDYPDSDLNFSFRLQQLTSLKVHPDGVIVDLDDPEILNYPFVYLLEPGNIELSPTEVAGMRNYLLNGGFMMVDDFWG